MMTSIATAVQPSPTPTEIDPYLVSPGIYGFLTFLVLAILGWLLFSSFIRHIRKANFHARQREEELYGRAQPDYRRTIPIDPHLQPRQGPFAETVLGGKELGNDTAGEQADGERESKD